MPNTPLITVIVPVYNVEKYLPRCVDSIINQTYKNLEIILVDDGSTDSSPAICDGYAKKDSRVNVIHKQNGGASSARNAALDIASGDYIGFAVYKTEYDPEEWTEYYIKTLPKNGICSVTMQEDYMPEAYPAKIMSATDKSKIFAKGSGVGYIASQKIIHTMQYLNWYKAAKNI